jgi:hypothetical protein
MEHEEISRQLALNKNVFRYLLQGMKEDMYTWQPEPGKWCLLEIVCHLCDEEREDFRTRVKHVLERPNDPMPSIDPQGWVQSRNYMNRDYEATINDFINEREISVNWLNSLSSAEWNNVHLHPKFGPLSAAMLLANWLAHDYLHIRQITRTKYYYLQKHSDVNLGYAGDW